jgi:hypothetical protein
MFNAFCLGVALTVGQAGPPTSLPTSPYGTVVVSHDSPPRIPTSLPIVGLPTATQSGTSTIDPKAGPPPKTGDGDTPKAEKEDEGENKDEKKDDEKKAPEKGCFMKFLEGTPLGCQLDACKVKVDGWIDTSYTASSDHRTNLPLGWNDRANRFLLQQFWVNVERPVDTDSKEIDAGWKVAFLYGSDYRDTLIRGFLNNQLKNSTLDRREPNGFQQNLYGIDFPIFYVNAWLPGVGGEGTEVQLGRMLCPLGYEATPATATPFMSRSYAFINTPFFMTGAMAITKVDKHLTVKNMVANGNDVWFDGSEELRYMGQVIMTSDDGNTSLSLGTSLGRGKFNAGRPNGPAQGVTTIGLAYEPFGRNNYNAFDVVFTQKYDDTFSTAFEFDYCYQQGVPAIATGSPRNFGGASGTADWLSFVKYFIVNFDDRTAGQVRLEAFYDAVGQRTGFEGWYYAATLGAVLKPADCTIFRPEIRYDYNGYARPFEGKHGLFTAGADLIWKF